jgi:hypothetical protein
LQQRFAPARREKFLSRLVDKDDTYFKYFLDIIFMAIALSSNELERVIEVLSSVGQKLQLTRFERFSYRTLLVSVDLATASFFVFVLAVTIIVFTFDARDALGSSWWIPAIACIVIFIVSIPVGIIALALNIPLLRKTFREERRLKRLGLDSLSKSLWEENRRTQWISRLRGGVLMVAGIVLILLGVFIASDAVVGLAIDDDLFFLALFYVIIGALLFGTRHLRNQRERMDLAASADELRIALQSLRDREGAEVISVPAEILEKTAIIESAQITQDRKDAVLQSATFRPNAYAVAFSREAAEQRAMLSVPDRIELEDLVADLSTDGPRVEDRAEAASGATLQVATKSEHVEVDCLVDPVSRGIQIIALRHREDASRPSLNGADNV